jgi:hypothetical protein
MPAFRFPPLFGRLRRILRGDRVRIVGRRTPTVVALACRQSPVSRIKFGTELMGCTAKAPTTASR